jgi:hypothetical protein
MRCFNHSEIRAVGLCKHCNKALCHDCANDLGFGLACRGVHEQEVTSVNSMVERASRVQAVNRSNKYLSPFFFLVFGSFFAGYELYTGNRGAGFGLWLGGLFIAYGLYLALVVRRTYLSDEA